MPELNNVPPPDALFADASLYQQEGSVLGKRFGMVPFSVLDARQGLWQTRKKEWIALGIKGEEGRVDASETESFYEDNPERVAGHGLSESQRLNKARREYGSQQMPLDREPRRDGVGRDAGQIFKEGAPARDMGC